MTEERCRPDDAVDIRHPAAAAAHQVVVVVADACLVARRRTRRLDAPNQAGGDAGPQDVVDRLGGDLPERLAHLFRDVVGRRVRRLFEGGQDGEPGRGDTETRGPQPGLGGRLTRRGHSIECPPYLEWVKISWA